MVKRKQLKIMTIQQALSAIKETKALSMCRVVVKEDRIEVRPRLGEKRLIYFDWIPEVMGSMVLRNAYDSEKNISYFRITENVY